MMWMVISQRVGAPDSRQPATYEIFHSEEKAEAKAVELRKRHPNREFFVERL